MAYQSSLRFYLINPADGKYFTASQAGTGVWTVYTVTDKTPITAPQGWSDFTIGWDRVLPYYGVMRAVTNSFGFTEDGRAILRKIYYAGWGGAVHGSEAQCILQICLLDAGNITPGIFSYKPIYQGYINFATASDEILQLTFHATCIDSILKRNLMARSSTSYSIPYWVPDGLGGWIVNAYAQPLYHKGLKLLYNQTFDTGAVVGNPVILTLPTGSGAPGDQVVFPSLTRVDYVQVNGSRTYIANDILQQQLLIGQQQYDSVNTAGGPITEYTNQSYCIKNLLSDNSNIEINGKIQFVISSISFYNPAPGDTQRIVFEAVNVPPNGTVIAATDRRRFAGLIIGNQPGHATGATVTLTNLIYVPDGTPSIPPQNNLSSFTNILFTYDLSILTTDPISFIGRPKFINGAVTGLTLSNFTPTTSIAIPITFTTLQFSIYSDPTNYATPDPLSAVTAPILPPSPALGFKPARLFEQLTLSMFTKQTDPYGFPDLTNLYQYSGQGFRSDFLSDETLDRSKNWDNVPAFTLWVSGNSLRDITGIDYLATSIDDAFKTAQGFWSVGMGIETDPTTGIENLRLEPLSFFFDANTQLLDLGTNFAAATLKITPFTQLQGNYIKSGYQQRQQNADYGLDSFCVEQDYSLPIVNTIADIDMTIPGNPEMYQIEFARGEANNKDQSGANADNAVYIIEVDPDPTHAIETTIYSPDGTPGGALAQPCLTYPTVQNSDPTAASAPYILGLNYPDTAINISLSPGRNMRRNGALLHSFLDGLTGENLAFRKQYQLLFNNWIAGGGGFTEALYPAVKSNLQVGGVGAGLVGEADDIPIDGLSSNWGQPGAVQQLFMPYLIEFDTSAPINTYQVFGSDPRGYVKITVNLPNYGMTDLRGFVWKVDQNIGTQNATHFTLLACPGQNFLTIN